MENSQHANGEAPLESVLRRMLLLCARDFTARQDQVDCAELLLATGYRNHAALLYDLVFLRDGFAGESIAVQAEIGARTGLWPEPPSPPPAIHPDPGHVTELTIADVRHLLAVPRPTQIADLPATHTADLKDLCEKLCAALRQSSAPEALGGLLVDAKRAALDASPPAVEDAVGGIATVTEAIALNILRQFLLANYDLAYAPLGSSRLFHAAARSHPAGLGAYGRNLGATVSNGRQLLGLIQLAGGTPGSADVSRDDIQDWAAIFSTRLTGGALHDAIEELGDLGYLRALHAILAHALRDPSASPDRQLLMRVRDAGLDDNDLELARQAQQALARWWSGDKHEWLALGDILAYRGDYDQSRDAFLTALRLDPGDGHANASMAAFDAGDFTRLHNQGGFGTPAHRRIIRAERRSGTARPISRAAEIARLDEPDIFERLAPELAPCDAAELRRRYDHSRPIHIRRLGARRARSQWGVLPLLRGVEAIRGICISSVPFAELRIALGHRTLYRGAPAGLALPDAELGERKYVFNVWLDFSLLPRGRHDIELSLIDIEGRACRHYEQVVIAAPLAESDAPASDALVAPPESRNTPLEAAINARPSMIRPASRRLFDQPPRNVLVIRADQLGDLVCSITAIRRLRELLPGARITGLLTQANAPLAASLALFDEVIVIDFPADLAENRRIMPLDRQEKLRAQLAPYRFDLAIDLSYNPPARPLLLLSGARFLYGCRDRDFSYLDLGFEAASHDPINGSECVPATAKILAMVEWLGIAMHGAPLTVQPTTQSRDTLASFGLAHQRYAVLHGGARLAFTRWPYFVELARLITSNTDLHVVLMGEAVPGQDRANERLHVMPGELDFETFDALISFCSVFVGNDSGPKHLAALRGIPTVGIHCARNNWNEWGHETAGLIISRRIPCAGCQIQHDAEDCGKAIACVTNIRPEEVYAAVAGLVEV